jgi:hypothetical protein
MSSVASSSIVIAALVRRLNAGRVAAQRVSAAALNGEGSEPT